MGTVKELYAAAVEAAERVAASRSGGAKEDVVPGFFRLWNDEQIQHLQEDNPAEERMVFDDARRLTDQSVNCPDGMRALTADLSADGSMALERAAEPT